MVFKKGHKINLGKKYTEETRNRMKLAHIGLKTSYETRQKMSIIMKGRKHKPETIEKISRRAKGRVISLDTRTKMSQSRKGKKHSDVTKQKIGLANKGFHHTDESKQKLREARLNQVMPRNDTKPEKMMQLALQLQGIKFRTHEPITGQPDIFIEPNICIFVDGDYWHANPDLYKPDFAILKKNRILAKEIWARDIEINHRLNRLGYQVIRLWEHDIKENTDNCAVKIVELIKSINSRIDNM